MPQTFTDTDPVGARRFGGDCCRRNEPYGPGFRVAEQVPYCGDCDNLIGPNYFNNNQVRYIGYLPWTRGCALGCYFREISVAEGRGRWADGVEMICNGR
jgi:hypothetical protein